jgi:hypothetical protein
VSLESRQLVVLPLVGADAFASSGLTTMEDEQDEARANSEAGDEERRPVSDAREGTTLRALVDAPGPMR